MIRDGYKLLARRPGVKDYGVRNTFPFLEDIGRREAAEVAAYRRAEEAKARWSAVEPLTEFKIEAVR